MKKIARATLGLLLASTGLATAEEGVDLLPESRRLRAAHAILAAHPEDRNAQNAYLEAFPDDPKTFMAVFMPEDPGQLQDSKAYIAPLGTIGRHLPGTTFEKLLRIETASSWEPGGLDDLQYVTLRLALADPIAFVAAFSGLRPTAQRAVAAFLADGPQGPREEALGLVAKLVAGGHREAAGQLRKEIRLSEARQSYG